MACQTRVSEAVIRRLPVYYRHLQELEQMGVERISSRELGDKMHYTASQIRQDINCFGGFGQQGYGYHVPSLRRHMASILGLEKTYSAVLIGAGNIGRAVSNYKGFEQDGILIRAVFDKDPDLVGLNCGPFIIKPYDELDEYLEQNPMDIGIIAVPAEAAQSVADRIIECGISAIWNFAPVDIQHPDSVVSTHVHLTDSLHILTYLMNEEALFNEIDARAKVAQIDAESEE
ncbi:MAG: redox-sensing transcriptional repressor Rex [Clostridia bacterium]|nr:redox-sensing transcriptional repressor Rex [Clostridia bacterium]